MSRSLYWRIPHQRSHLIQSDKLMRLLELESCLDSLNFTARQLLYSNEVSGKNNKKDINMSVDTELLFDFYIKHDSPKEVIYVLNYLFSNDNSKHTINFDENKILKSKEPTESRKLKECNMFKTNISHAFFSTDLESYRYNWRAIAGYLSPLREKRRKTFHNDTEVFYFHSYNRLYNNQLNDFLEWITPYIDCLEQSKICIGWIKYEDCDLPKLIILKQKNTFEILY